MLSIDYYIMALQLAFISYVFTDVLVVSGGMLEPYLDLLLRLKRTGKVGEYLSKPLGMCDKCFAGQVALWYAVVHNESFNIMMLLAFVSICIIFVLTIKRILK